jgi:urease accessory protein
MVMITAMTIMGTATTMATTMTSALSLQRLLAWASPAFPIGSFGYSGGLETAIVRGAVRNAADTQAWIAGSLACGALRNDAILAVAAHGKCGDGAALADLSDLCLALTPARERHAELQVMGSAFIAAARAWPDPVLDRLPAACPYPIAFGALAGAARIAPEDMLIAFLTATVQAQISVAIRLVPIGQSEGLVTLAALEPLVAGLARDYAAAGLDDLGSIGLAADIAAMAHETLETRIFRS